MINASIKTTRYVAIASLLTVFVIDVIAPAAFVVDILYLCCILLVCKQGRKTIITLSMTSCLLIFIDILFFNHRLSLSEWINRGISILAILIVSYIAILYGKLNEVARLKEQQYLNDLKKMLFITSHKVRKPAANIIGLIETLNSDGPDLSAGELKVQYAYLLFSANELDNFIKELNLFIEKTEQQNQT
jgi:signal transduction histidine kinase